MKPTHELRSNKSFNLDHSIFQSPNNVDTHIHFKTDFLSAYQTKEYNLLNYVDLLEKQFFVNKYYLSHTFKKSTGFTVVEYITHKRIIWAMDLLTVGQPALEVAHTVGFSDYSTFYKAFKKITGISPREYSSQ